MTDERYIDNLFAGFSIHPDAKAKSAALQRMRTHHKVALSEAVLEKITGGSGDFSFDNDNSFKDPDFIQERK